VAIRPLDFGRIDAVRGAIGRPAQLFWPVHAYRITLPRSRQRAGHKLNPFERVVLDILDALGNVNEKTIAAETCIPEGLIRSILLKLQEMSLVDENNVVLRNRSGQSVAPIEEVYGSAVVFRERIGGNLLPFIYVFDDESVLRTTDKRYDHLLRSDREIQRMGPPSAQEVIDAVSAMRKRARTHARNIKVPTLQEVRVGNDPEEHHLNCQVVILGYDGDFRIADPFGFGYSPILERVLNETLVNDTSTQDWMTTWTSNLLPQIPKPQQAKPDFAQEPSDRLFSELVNFLTPKKGKSFRTSADIYAALEWSLFHACEAHDPETAIKILRTFDGDGYAQYLSAAARNIGFLKPKTGFRPVDLKKFHDFANRKPEMETVIAIALVQADADPNHPLRAIPPLYPDFVRRLRALGADKVGKTHAKNAAPVADVELESDAMMRTVVTALVPAIRFEETGQHIDPEVSADLRLLARNRLIQDLGYDVFDRVGAEARQALLSAEQFLGVCADGDDGCVFITDLCSALQATLRHLFGGRGSIDLTDSQLRARAEERAVKAGLGNLPTALKTVKIKRVRNALSGNDPTLGSLVIALLIVSDEVLLENIANSLHRLLPFIADLLELRGHANVPRPMTRAEALSLGKKVTDTVVTLAQIDKQELSDVQ